MKIRIPSKKVCEEFRLIYELEGCQKAVNFLTKYYGIRRMRIILDGRKVMRTKAGKTYEAHYYRNRAYFTRRGMNKRNVFHELYHHLVDVKGIEMPRWKEERTANLFVREVMKKS